jgi:hypothetical protein
VGVRTLLSGAQVRVVAVDPVLARRIEDVEGD